MRNLNQKNGRKALERVKRHSDLPFELVGDGLTPVLQTPCGKGLLFMSGRGNFVPFVVDPNNKFNDPTFQRPLTVEPVDLAQALSKLKRN